MALVAGRWQRKVGPAPGRARRRPRAGPRLRDRRAERDELLGNPPRRRASRRRGDRSGLRLPDRGARQVVPRQERAHHGSRGGGVRFRRAHLDQAHERFQVRPARSHAGLEGSLRDGMDGEPACSSSTGFFSRRSWPSGRGCLSTRRTAGSPPVGHRRRAPRREAGAASISPRKQMVATPQFWGLFTAFFVGATAGSMVIGVIQLFGKDALTARGMTHRPGEHRRGDRDGALLRAHERARAGSSGARSPTAIGRKQSIVLMCLLQGIMMIAFYFIGG